MNKVVRILCKHLFKHQVYDKFIVLGHARTGSNYLLNGLRTVSSIEMHGELLAAHNREIGKNYDNILNNIFFKEVPIYIKNVGFKLFYYHLSKEELDKFLMDNSKRIIHLKRNNKLRTIISLEKAKRTNKWQSKKATQEKIKIKLDVGKLVEDIEAIYLFESKFDSLLKEKNFEVLDIFYENLVKKPEIVFNRITTFLKCTTKVNHKRIILKKQGNHRIEDDISNYEEVYNLLQRTKYNTFLEN